MTDRQLDEYTRLKIKEATKELRISNSTLFSDVKKMSEEKELKIYKLYLYGRTDNFNGLAPLNEIVYIDDCEVGKELEELKKRCLDAETTIRIFNNNNSLFDRLKKAIRGTL